MGKDLSQADLAKIGAKVVEQNEKAKVRGNARNSAIKRLIATNEKQFETLLDEEKRKLGIT